MALQVLIPALVAAFLYFSDRFEHEFFQKPFFDHAQTMAYVPGFFACLNLLLGLFYPKGFLKVEKFFMTLLYLLGVGLSWLLLVPLYWTFFTVAHLMLLIRRKDPLHRKLDSSATSYWVTRERIEDPKAHYGRQY